MKTANYIKITENFKILQTAWFIPQIGISVKAHQKSRKTTSLIPLPFVLALLGPTVHVVLAFPSF